jgi:glutamate/tyrosine decarboxylase-like PLP-dependent enzyme
VSGSPDFEVLCPAQFGIFCFRATPKRVPPEHLDALNERVNARVVAGGRFLISPTRLSGKYSLRMCTLGFRTTQDDIRALFGEIMGALEIESNLGNGA